MVLGEENRVVREPFIRPPRHRVVRHQFVEFGYRSASFFLLSLKAIGRDQVDVGNPERTNCDRFATPLDGLVVLPEMCMRVSNLEKPDVHQGIARAQADSGLKRCESFL
jgi:hypothetical protein